MCSSRQLEPGAESEDWVSGVEGVGERGSLDEGGAVSKIGLTWATLSTGARGLAMW